MIIKNSTSTDKKNNKQDKKNNKDDNPNKERYRLCKIALWGKQTGWSILAEDTILHSSATTLA